MYPVSNGVAPGRSPCLPAHGHVGSDPVTYRKGGDPPGASAVLISCCKGCHLPGLQHVMGSLGWQGSAVSMPAAWVRTALAKPGSPWDECWEMVLFIFSFCFEV